MTLSKMDISIMKAQDKVQQAACLVSMVARDDAIEGSEDPDILNALFAIEDILEAVKSELAVMEEESFNGQKVG